MGESFKLHAQALIGYVDEVHPEMADTMPVVAEQPVMGMQSAY